MQDLLVWYQYVGLQLTGSMHLTIENDSIAYTIANFESRNSDMKITHYLNSDNIIIAVP